MLVTGAKKLPEKHNVVAAIKMNALRARGVQRGAAGGGAGQARTEGGRSAEEGRGGVFTARGGRLVPRHRQCCGRSHQVRSYIATFIR